MDLLLAAAYLATYGTPKGEPKPKTIESAAQIKALFRRASVRFHPDRNDGDEKAEETFKRVNEACSVLNRHVEGKGPLPLPVRDVETLERQARRRDAEERRRVKAASEPKPPVPPPHRTVVADPTTAFDFDAIQGGAFDDEQIRQLVATLLGNPDLQIPSWLRGLLRELGIDLVDEDILVEEAAPPVVSPEVAAQMHRHQEQQRRREAQSGRGWTFGNAQNERRRPAAPQPVSGIPGYSSGVVVGSAPPPAPVQPPPPQAPARPSVAPAPVPRPAPPPDQATGGRRRWTFGNGHMQNRKAAQPRALPAPKLYLTHQVWEHYQRTSNQGRTPTPVYGVYEDAEGRRRETTAVLQIIGETAYVSGRPCEVLLVA